MDRWDDMKLTGPNRYHNRRHQNNPSFSSTLLDDIYRSIDGEEEPPEDELILYTETMRKKRTTAVNSGHHHDDHMASVQRACMIEKWIEKKVSEKVVFRRESSVPPEFPKKSRSHRDGSSAFWGSSSSDSSSGGCFSSSELDSVINNNGVVSSSSSSSCFTPHRPKPIRTSVSEQKLNHHDHQMFDKCSKPKHENGFVKTKSKAMKIYGDLKKAKQPISPGGRLATFLNSLFTARTVKKAKISASVDDMSTKSPFTSTCSSASSFSRSCLSKTPSSRGKLSNGTKRSVTFHPVSVIVGEDCQPCGQKSLDLTNAANDELRLRIMEKHRHVEEVARDMLRNYQKKVEYEFNLRNVTDNYVAIEKDEYDDDDCASDASSDLFELDNLSAIGIERYREELPVYETTHLGTNRAIASGLI